MDSLTNFWNYLHDGCAGITIQKRPASQLDVLSSTQNTFCLVDLHVQDFLNYIYIYVPPKNLQCLQYIGKWLFLKLHLHALAALQIFFILILYKTCHNLTCLHYFEAVSVQIIC